MATTELRVAVAGVILAGVGLAGDSARSRDDLSAARLGHLHALIKPQPGESKWAQIRWLTNIKEARQRATAEDRPLLLWRSGGGDVLGRT